MELIFKNSFYRDLDSIGSRAPNKEIEKLLLKILQAQTLPSIPGIKKLRPTKQFEYKIELKVQTKVYWILCDAYFDKIELVRIKSETWCKANL